jgi:hypothetical protein
MMVRLTQEVRRQDFQKSTQTSIIRLLSSGFDGYSFLEQHKITRQTQSKKNLMSSVLYILYNALGSNYRRQCTRDRHYKDDVLTTVPEAPASPLATLQLSRFIALPTHSLRFARREFMSSFSFANLRSLTLESSEAKFSGQLND